MSQLEELFWLHLLAEQQATTIPRMPEREYRFDPARRWRLDFAWPEWMVAVEVQGLGRRGSGDDPQRAFGRHQMPGGVTEDYRKLNAAVLAGWRVLFVTGAMVRSGEAVRVVVRTFQLWEIAQIYRGVTGEGE